MKRVDAKLVFPITRNFTRVFGRETCMTPSGYRREAGEPCRRMREGPEP